MFPAAFTTSFEEGQATTPENLAKRFGGSGSDDFVIGAFDESGALVGFVALERETRLKIRHKAHVIGMFVAPGAQGNSLGKRLLDRLIEDARRLPGLERLLLTVTHSNDAARDLYLRAGFISFGVEKNALKFEGTYYDKEYFALTL